MGGTHTQDGPFTRKGTTQDESPDGTISSKRFTRNETVPKRKERATKGGMNWENGKAGNPKPEVDSENWKPKPEFGSGNPTPKPGVDSGSQFATKAGNRKVEIGSGS